MIDDVKGAAVAALADERPPTAADRSPAELNHVVQFYEDDGFLCDTVARFIGAGLAAGESVVVVATELHRHGFRQRLAANDFDVDRALASGRLRLLDADETLAHILVDGMPDRERVDEVLGTLIREAVGNRKHARA